MKLKPGDKLIYIKGEFNPGIQTAHVRAIVDNYVVYRAWSRRKKCWVCQVEHISVFELFVDCGRMQVVSAKDEDGES